MQNIENADSVKLNSQPGGSRENKITNKKILGITCKQYLPDIMIQASSEG